MIIWGKINCPPHWDRKHGIFTLFLLTFLLWIIAHIEKRTKQTVPFSDILWSKHLCKTTWIKNYNTVTICIAFYFHFYGLCVYSSTLYFSFLCLNILKLYIGGIIQCFLFCVWLLLLNIIFVTYAQIVCKLISLYFHCSSVHDFTIVYPFILPVHVHLSCFSLGPL